MNYPHVRDEFHTMRLVAKGLSLARFGDGELKMCFGAGYAREEGSQKLANELLKTLRTPSINCLVGIPTMDPAGPKYQNWLRHKERFEEILQPRRLYYSAFVSRPDSAPWINSAEYGELVQSIWAGKRVTVLCEAEGSMFKTVRRAAYKARHIVCPRHEAYAQIDKLQAVIEASAPQVVIMACGPTATCLAGRLSAKHIHAVDLGSAGGFLGRLLS